MMQPNCSQSLTYRIHELSELGEVVPPAGMDHLFAMWDKLETD